MENSLGLYLHIPFCRSKCDYCDFYSLAGRDDRMDDYQKALLQHIAETAPHARKQVVNSVYIGGGTPTWYGETVSWSASTAPTPTPRRRRR